MGAYVTAKAAGDLTGRSEKTIRNWIKAGKPRAERSGRDYRIDLSELARVCPLVTTDARAESSASVDLPVPYEAVDLPPPVVVGLPEAADVLAAVVRLLDTLGDRDRQLATLYAERATLAGELHAIAERTRSLEEDMRRLKTPRGGLLRWRRAAVEGKR